MIAERIDAGESVEEVAADYDLGASPRLSLKSIGLRPPRGRAAQQAAKRGIGALARGGEQSKPKPSRFSP